MPASLAREGKRAGTTPASAGPAASPGRERRRSAAISCAHRSRETAASSARRTGRRTRGMTWFTRGRLRAERLPELNVLFGSGQPAGPGCARDRRPARPALEPEEAGEPAEAEQDDERQRPVTAGKGAENAAHNHAADAQTGPYPRRPGG